MYEPKVGERVRVVANTCGHDISRGKIIKIVSKHGESSWWVKNYGVYVKAEDVARLNPSIRKILKTLEKSVRRALEEAVSDHPELGATLREVVREVADEGPAR